MKKRILAALLMAVMLQTLLPAAALAEGQDGVGADAAAVTEITTPLSFDGNTDDVSGAGYDWVKETKTLTLSGIRLTVADSNSALSLEAGSTVVIQDETVNEITNTSNGAGIFVSGRSASKVSFLGAGSLAVHTQGDGISTADPCRIIIGGSVALTVDAGKNGIYSLIDCVWIKDSANVTVRAEEDHGIACGFGGGESLVPFTMSGTPTVEIYAGADGIQAIDGLDITGGTLTVSAAGNGIYSDYKATLANCTLDLPESGTGNGFAGAEDASFQNVTITAACGGTALSANGTITMTDCTADLASSGAGYALFADGLKVDGGTLTAGGSGGGISVEYAGSDLKDATVTVNARHGLSAKDLSLTNTNIVLEAAGQASITADQSWTLDGQSLLTNSGYLENGGHLTGAGAFINNGVYYHREDAALGLTGALTSGTGARVICPLELDASRLEQLGAVSRFLTAARDYTQIPAPRDEGGFIWDAGGRVLTLSGVQLEADGEFALKIPDGTAIHLAGGPSSISNTSNGGVGIQAEGVTALTGESTLSVSASIGIHSTDYLTIYDTALQIAGDAGIVGQTLELGDTALSVRSVSAPCLSATQRVKVLGCALDLMSLNSCVVEVLEREGTEPTWQLSVSPLPEGRSVKPLGGSITLLDGEGEAERALSTEDRTACIKVYFNSEGGSSCPTRVAAQGDTLQLPVPERPGYVFSGWYTASGVKLSGERAAFTEDTTLYAKWTRNSSGGGTSHSDRPSAKVDGVGGKVTTGSGSVTITPDEGYQIGKITVNGNVVDIPENGTLTGLKRSDKVVVTFEKIPEKPEKPTVDMSRYTDLDAGAWYFDAVRYVVEHGLFAGTSDTAFSPSAPMTRAMLVTVLYRAAGEPSIEDEIWGYPFADVDAESWYGTAVYWARLEGVTSGTGEETFTPDGPITREQLAVMLYRCAGCPATPNLLLDFTDAAKVSDFAQDAVRWAVERAIITGKDGGVLDPQGTATRAEVAVMLQRSIMTDNK